MRRWPLWAAVFLDLCGFSAILVDIQFRAEGMGAPGWKIGLILASTFVVQALTSPLWGRLSDRHGRKKTFLATSLLSAASMAIYALAPNPWLLLVSRLVAGAGAANTAIALAAVADDSQGDDLAPAMGKMQVALNLGMILGPTFGGLAAAQMGSTFVGWMACCASLFGAALALAFARMKPGSFEQEKATYSFGSLFREFPSVAPFFLISVTAWFSLATLEGTFGRLIEKTLGLGQWEFGLIFAFESAIGVGVSLFLIKVLMGKGRDKAALAGSYLLMGLGLALFPFAPAFGWLFVASLLYALGQGLASPAVNALCSRQVGESRQGELFGLMQGARSLGFILGPVLGGALFDWQPMAPYLFAGAICGLAACFVSLIPAAPPQES